MPSNTEKIFGAVFWGKENRAALHLLCVLWGLLDPENLESLTEIFYRMFPRFQRVRFPTPHLRDHWQHRWGNGREPLDYRQIDRPNKYKNYALTQAELNDLATLRSIIERWATHLGVTLTPVLNPEREKKTNAPRMIWDFSAGIPCPNDTLSVFVNTDTGARTALRPGDAVRQSLIHEMTSGAKAIAYGMPIDGLVQQLPNTVGIDVDEDGRPIGGDDDAQEEEKEAADQEEVDHDSQQYDDQQDQEEVDGDDDFTPLFHLLSGKALPPSRPHRGGTNAPRKAPSNTGQVNAPRKSTASNGITHLPAPRETTRATTDPKPSKKRIAPTPVPNDPRYLVKRLLSTTYLIKEFTAAHPEIDLSMMNDEQFGAYLGYDPPKLGEVELLAWRASVWRQLGATLGPLRQVVLYDEAASSGFTVTGDDEDDGANEQGEEDVDWRGDDEMRRAIDESVEDGDEWDQETRQVDGTAEQDGDYENDE